MTEQPSSAPSLRELLVAWRARTSPEDLGLPRSPRHKSGPGVSQEQLARALGISLRHYNSLEVGAAKQPSFALLADLIDVLRLTDGERLALFDALVASGRAHACGGWARAS